MIRRLRSLLNRALGRPGLGYLPDPEDERDRPLAALGLAATPPVSASLRHLVIDVLDQGATSSCVAHAWAQALRIGDQVDGQHAPQLDAIWFHYWNSRAHHGAAAHDDGTFLRTCGKGVIRFGRPVASAWSKSHPINRRPSWGAYRAAFDRRGPRGYYRIASGDLDGIRRAIASHKPVVFGIDVPRSFMAATGPAVVEPPKLSDPIAGGHAMCVVGYEGTRFELVNSWGTSWRQNGFVWITDEWMARARDCWAVDP